MDDPPVAVVEGSKGKSEIYEVWDGGRLIEYQVHFGGTVESFPNLGEAYIVAGQKAGAKT